MARRRRVGRRARRVDRDRRDAALQRTHHEQTFVSNPESKRAATAIEQRQGSADRIVETVVIQPASPAAQAAVIAAVTKDPAVKAAQAGPSADGSSLVRIVLRDDRVEADKQIGDVITAAQAAAAKESATAKFAGQASIDRDFQKVAETDLQTGESIGIPIALIILLIVFGALVSALLPLMLAGVAIVVSLALTALVGQVFELSFFVTNMITMMGLAVGIDYVLFIVSRYREERLLGRDKVAAIERAGSTASRAVLFSGITVVVALVGMLIVPTTIFISLATGAILVVLSAVAAALTLLPAVLSLLGDRIDRGQVGRLLPRRFRGEGTRQGFWPRAVGDRHAPAGAVAGRHRRVLLVAVHPVLVDPDRRRRRRDDAREPPVQAGLRRAGARLLGRRHLPRPHPGGGRRRGAARSPPRSPATRASARRC